MSNITSPAEKPNPHLAVRPDWLAHTQEDILEPALPIIDAHHHLWDRSYHPYQLPQYLADTGSGHNITKTVVIESHTMYRAGGVPLFAPVGETEFVNGIAAMSASGDYGSTEVCAAIVGHVDLRAGPAAREVLEAHIRSAGSRFRGIRNASAWHADKELIGSVHPAPPGLLLDADFRKGFACLAPLGLSFDAWLYHTQIDELTDLAGAFPETQFVLDHMGSPLGLGPYAGKRAEVFEDWRKKIERLAVLPNVVVKLSGQAMRVAGFNFQLQPAAPSSHALAEAWKPYFEVCIEAFGCERSMFASNFPVDKGSCSYPVLWNAYKRFSAGYSQDERSAMFQRNAASIYRL